MADITASLVKQLRDATNVSMMECKKALVETDGDMEKASRLLRERGMAVAAKRATKEANQGVVACASTPDGKTLALVEVNCETDFVARNESFRDFVTKVAQKALEADCNVAEEMKDELMDRIAAIGENLKIGGTTRYVLGGTGKLASYIHLGGKVGVLIEVGCEKDETTGQDAFVELVRDLTLHIAACSPRYLVSDDVAADEIAAEREIYAKQAAGKPEQVIEKIVGGKLRKYFAEICLVEQGFVKEPKQSVKALLAETGKALGDTLTVRRFVRYQIGG